MVNNPLVAFQEAMQAAGVFLAADAYITPDGQLHRARAADDKPGALSIWYNLHLDAPASGAAGNWRTGARLTWCGKRLQALTSAEHETLRLRIEKDKRCAQAEQERRHKDAARRAVRIWRDAAPASPDHPYLLKKQIAPGIARQSGDWLILPITGFDGDLRGVQTISPTGEKRFTKGMHKQGAFIRTDGMPSPDSRLIIAEGWATASTLAALSPGAVVIAACDAGNLLSVATEARKRWSGIDLVICPDFDAIGRQKGQEAAIAARARIVKPDRLPSNLPAWVSDWNDLRQFQRQGAAS